MVNNLIPGGGIEGRSVVHRLLQILDGDIASGLFGGLVDRADRGSLKRILAKVSLTMDEARLTGEFSSLSSADEEWVDDLLLAILSELAMATTGSSAVRERFLVDGLRGAYAVVQQLRGTDAYLRADAHTEHSVGDQVNAASRTVASRYAEHALDVLASVLSEWVKTNATMDVQITNAALGEVVRTLDEATDSLQSSTASIQRPLAQEIIRAHRRAIEDRAPAALVGREAELKRVEALRDGVPHFGWSGTEKAGKSGLSFAIAREGVEWAHVVPFFVSRYEAGANDRASFIQVTGAQLAALAGERHGPGNLSKIDAETMWRDLLARAAYAARNEGKLVLLLVDGLDEDAVLSSDSRVGSIAALLPTAQECRSLGVRVLVTARPNPPLPPDVSKDHWLRESANWTDLSPSPVAQKSIDPREIHELMQEPVGRDIAALLACAGAALTVADLGFISGQPPARIDEILSQQRSRNVVRVRDASGQAAFILGHQDAHTEVIRNLDPSLWDMPELRDDARWPELRDRALAPFEQRVIAATHRMMADGWRYSPPYLLSGALIAGLVERNEVGLALKIVSDPGRIQSIVDREGSPYSAAAQISAAIGVWTVGSASELAVLARVLFSFNIFAAPHLTVPAGTAAAHASVGNPDIAVRIARGIQDPVLRARELIDLSEVLARRGERITSDTILEDAMAAAADTHGTARDQVLARLSEVFAERGDLHRAQECARSIRNLSSRHAVLRGIAAALMRSHAWEQFSAFESRLSLADRARIWLYADRDGDLPPGTHPGHGRSIASSLAARLAGGRAGAEVWAELAGATSDSAERDSYLDRAAAVAASISSGAGRAAAWLAISRSRPSDELRKEDLSRAVHLVREEVAVPRQADRFLTLVACEFASIGDIGGAVSCIADMSSSKSRVRAWVDLVSQGAGRSDLRTVAGWISHISVARGRDEAWAAGAVAFAAVGNTADARAAVERIDRRSTSNNALIRVCEAYAAAEQLDELAWAVAEITDAPAHTARGLTLLARVRGLTGDPEGASRDLERARKHVTSGWWPIPRVASSLIRAVGAPEAIALADRIPDPRARDTSLVALAVASAEAGDTTSAAGALHTCRSRSTGGIGWAAVAIAEARGGRVTEAADSAPRATPRSRGRIWAEIAAARIRAGEASEAFKIAEWIAPAARQADVWSRMALQFAELGRDDDAHAAVSRIDGRIRRARAWAELAPVESLHDAGRALEVLRHAESEAHKIGDSELRAETWRLIARKYLEIGDERLSRSALEEAVVVASGPISAGKLVEHRIDVLDIRLRLGEARIPPPLDEWERLIEQVASSADRAVHWAELARVHKHAGNVLDACLALRASWMCARDATVGWDMFEELSPDDASELLLWWARVASS